MSVVGAWGEPLTDDEATKLLIWMNLRYRGMNLEPIVTAKIFENHPMQHIVANIILSGYRSTDTKYW